MGKILNTEVWWTGKTKKPSIYENSWGNPVINGLYKKKDTKNDWDEGEWSPVKVRVTVEEVE